MTVEYKNLPVEELSAFEIRDIRVDVLEKLKDRISQGYNPARPLTVVKADGKYIVADGNHRLRILQELGIKSVPCVIYEDVDPYKLAVAGNMDEDTYAPMDLFDWLDIIKKLRDEGLTQSQIGERIGWSESKVKQYSALLSTVVTQVLNLARQYQIGRVTPEVTFATFNFTEGWFRNSGLYDLCEKYQLALMESFIDDKCKWNKEKVQKEAAKYKRWQEQIDIAKDTLEDVENLSDVIAMIENDAFKTNLQLQQKIKSLNSRAKNKLICGDCIIELENIKDASIDIVITDPPYGIDYISNRSNFTKHITKTGIENDDDLKNALDVFETTMELLSHKTKPDAHLYVFTSWKVYPLFVDIMSKYFTIKNLLVWDKGNHGPGDLEGAWGNQYEMIIFATKGKKALNKRRGDIISIPRLSSANMIHPTQKPVELIKELLSVSAQKADIVCDPFMGSGSTIKAVKEYGGLNYIGIELDREIFEKAKAFIGGDID